MPAFEARIPKCRRLEMRRVDRTSFAVVQGVIFECGEAHATEITYPEVVRTVHCDSVAVHRGTDRVIFWIDNTSVLRHHGDVEGAAWPSMPRTLERSLIDTNISRCEAGVPGNVAVTSAKFCSASLGDLARA